MTGDKSRLIETTLPIYENHRLYFLPKKCTIDHNESDGDGNFMFVVNSWWYNKVLHGNFQADDR
jgi:hypothetical protein